VEQLLLTVISDLCGLGAFAGDIPSLSCALPREILRGGYTPDKYQQRETLH